MPEFDDVLQPAHYRLQLDYNPMAGIERYTVLLKDGETTATIYPVQHADSLPAGLLAFLCDEFNIEIERGDTFLFFDTLHIESFQNYWFGAFAGVMVLGDLPALEGPKHWEKECLGTFFVKPNYPGRASHICTAAFLVNAGIRGKGIGRTLADCFLQWAPRLGYTYCVFNLVFETNVAARSIWELLGFKRIGRIKSAGILKGHDAAVDALIYGRELVAVADATLGAYRFDKIKYYLETGKYPPMADRQEKLRLRLLASHYRLQYGKLMLRDREVVSDPARQLHICSELHLASHGGINKTTAAVLEKYHWTRIKDTVAAAIRNCAACRELAKADAPVRREPPRRGAARPGPADAHDAMLGPDLAALDDGLMAAVEAAQKRHKPAPARGPAAGTPSYAAVAAAAVAAPAHPFFAGDFLHPAFSAKYGAGKRHDARHDGVPVDPDVSAYDHGVGAGGDEIEIARALMQSNEADHGGDARDKPDGGRGDDANLFFKND